MIFSFSEFVENLKNVDFEHVSKVLDANSQFVRKEFGFWAAF